MNKKKSKKNKSSQTQIRKTKSTKSNINQEPKSTSLKQSLLSLFNTFWSFAKQDFRWATYAYAFVFIFVCIFINYHFDFYEKVLRPSFFSGDSTRLFSLFYGFIYFAVAIPILCIEKDYKTLKNYRFYLKVLFFIGIYSVSIGYYDYQNWKFPQLTYMEHYFIVRILSQLKSLVFIVVPLIFLKIFIDRKRVNGFYGLSRSTKHLDAYLLLFLVMVPFLIITSFTPDFLKAYPQFTPWHYEGVFGISTFARTLIFESAYTIDFIVVELFFRGALILGLTAIMGPKTILPMVAFYAAIHFGKPVVETISSVFGGYILGVLAYQTKHIWGGVIVHIAIALTMEVMGFIQYYVLD
jgi:hypothetical protein